jgi:N-acetylglucosaminyldiphosphoundecaprenol N-acetyl-beta-D-mannosaminyltransferase
MVLGCAIDRIDMETALGRCEEMVRSAGFGQHMAINAAKLVAMQGDAEMREITARCAIVTADGQAVVWASRVLGDPLPERVAGIDLMEALFGLAERRGFSVFILGAQAEVLERAVGELRRRHPRLRIAGYRDGYFSPEEDLAVADEIRAAAPDMLFVAISSPRKEYFLGQHGPDLGVGFAMGVGGAIDVVAGEVLRAPRWMQVVGLEWLFRLVQEPRRLLARYVRTNWRFVLLVLRERAARRR